MKKIKYYLETTIFNFVFADDDPAKQEIIRRLLQNWATFNGEMHISEILIDEIERCEEPKRTNMYELIQKYGPTMLLAEKYITEETIPEKFKNDALRIAIATVNNLDVIISWNLEHIVKLKTRRMVNGINMLLGYKGI